MKGWGFKTKSLCSSLFSVMLVLAFFCTGCGKDGKIESGEVQPDSGQEAEMVWMYMPETLELDAKRWMTDSAMFLERIRQFGDDIYFVIINDYDEETQKYGYRFYRYSIQDDRSERLTKIIHDYSPGLYTIGEDGSFYVANFFQSGGENIMQLIKYDAGGELIYRKDLAEELKISSREETGDAINIFVDSSGEVCLVCGKKVFFFDESGNCTGSMDPCDGRQNAQIESAGRGRNGDIYVKLMINTAGTLHQILLEADTDGRTFRTVSENFAHNGALGVGVEKDLLRNSEREAMLYDYDLAEQTGEALLCWDEYGIASRDVFSVGSTSDGRILAVVSEMNSGKRNVLLFSKVKVPKKEELLLGTIYVSTDLHSMVSKFNRDSNQYHITIKDYLEGQEWSAEAGADAWSKLGMEMAAGNGPDIVELRENQLTAMVKQGFLEDLYPYLEQADGIGREDFVGNVLKCAERDGKLAVLPRSFVLQTVVGHGSDVGTEIGWTREEFMTIAEQYPNAQILSNSGKENLLNFCLGYDMGAFVDRESGKCSFDTQKFIGLLEFADRYGSMVAEDDGFLPGLFQRRDILFNERYVMDFQWVEEENIKFEGDFCPIGYPTGDGNAANYIILGNSCGITASSQHKKGAWAFLEFYVKEEFGKLPFCFAALNKQLEDQMQQQIESVTHKVNENGEWVYDENGDPVMEQQVVRYEKYGNMIMEYHAATAQETERTMELIRTAQPRPMEDQDIWTIINEETADFFYGSKSAQQVADVIQNRVQLYLYEN